MFSADLVFTYPSSSPSASEAADVLIDVLSQPNYVETAKIFNGSGAILSKVMNEGAAVLLMLLEKDKTEHA